MTSTSGRAGSQPEPMCGSCSESSEALQLLSVALQTALDATTRISVPLAPAVAVAMGYKSIEPTDLPPALRAYCAERGLWVMRGNGRPHCIPATRCVPSVALPAAEPVAAQAPAPRAPLVERAPPVDDIPDNLDALSISTGSTNWQQEFGLGFSPDPSEFLTELSDSTQAQEPPEAPAPAVMPITPAPPLTHDHEDVPPSERWYVITVGREPGVYKGYHHINLNILGISGGTGHRTSSEEKGWKEYRAALAAGMVTKVVSKIEKSILTGNAAV
ncbi:hypothetical protein FPV67DRAFT_1784857 [Lyophyllum atratum]|nr:hypothetical protein FPV67DRAFT_1784857 [Lyophyllum atratum]